MWNISSKKIKNNIRNTLRTIPMSCLDKKMGRELELAFGTYKKDSQTILLFP
jgi:hypothetical protein